MNHKVCREYLAEIRERYRAANRQVKGQILDEFCQVCGYSRKYAIFRLSLRAHWLRKRPGPRPTYGPDVTKWFVVFWKKMRRICSKKMKQALPEWLRRFESPELTPEVRAKLLKMSPATMDRVLKLVRAHEIPHGLTLTKPGSFRKSKIPIRVHHWEVKTPGFMQADTVAHCGDNIGGAFGNTLTMTDIDSTWTENRAVWTKGSLPVFKQIKDIEENLPFKILGYSSDNGGEVLNQRLYHYFYESRNEGEKIPMTRSRAYRKNDQAHVEQKNWTHVRELFGYERVDHPDVVVLMNEIYKDFWSPLMNFFIPSMKLIRKTRIGARIKKEYDLPKTPYQRLLESADLSTEAKDKLRLRYESMDPFALSEGLDKRLERFFWLVKRKKQRWVA
jgi:hypothetical protein